MRTRVCKPIPETRHVVRRVIAELHPYRLRLAGYVLLLAGASLSGVGVPLATRYLVDHGLATQDVGDVLVSAVAILVLGVASTAATSSARHSATSSAPT
ncbi:MAG TPA: hypothetical protein VIL34_02240 [Actinopolymorphaceae bacterium]